MSAVKANNKDTYKATAVTLIVMGVLYLIDKLIHFSTLGIPWVMNKDNLLLYTAVIFLFTRILSPSRSNGLFRDSQYCLIGVRRFYTENTPVCTQCANGGMKEEVGINLVCKPASNQLFGTVTDNQCWVNRYLQRDVVLPPDLFGQSGYGTLSECFFGNLDGSQFGRDHIR